MNPSVEIFSQGEEVVTGQTVDTNAAWLAQQCVQLGFTVVRHTAVGELHQEAVLAAALDAIRSRHGGEAIRRATSAPKAHRGNVGPWETGGQGTASPG